MNDDDLHALNVVAIVLVGVLIGIGLFMVAI